MSDKTIMELALEDFEKQREKTRVELDAIRPCSARCDGPKEGQSFWDWMMKEID